MECREDHRALSTLSQHHARSGDLIAVRQEMQQSKRSEDEGERVV